ncbi:hypothetical protein HK103_003265 [Boothiomyces macroporosus]|uniref:FAD-binding domain-containing protein n=1 Tax=Boothiomyces macroporosus TaxID=261099 RepID=A0AAD5XZT2_9FUNG|nr:hypothetical protein HK103_003265 [Boothiomyces macroporosus]
MTNIIISGAGVAGLVFALALKNMGINVEVYEQAPEFIDNVGGAIGLYPNGLRYEWANCSVIRDISPDLLKKIRSEGRPYVYRRWMRHDGKEVAVGQEKYLRQFASEKEEQELASMGIRRWRLQNALCDATAKAGIPIHFGKRVDAISILNDGKVECSISDGSKLIADLAFGCDGVKSAMRSSLFGSESEPMYTGITCLMGSAPIAKSSPISGICFPASATSKCHACFYPANEDEIIFQIFFPTEEKPETWKALSAEEGKKECQELAKLLKSEGWHKMFTDPLESANSVLRVGLRAREPIPVWHANKTNPRVFLLGDAAHPPVPYIGQGAMMAIEDAGILSHLIKKFCKPTVDAPFDFSKLKQVATLYEELRIPRTTMMLASSKALGEMQLARSTKTNIFEVWMKEMGIWLDVKRYGTLPIMFQGAGYDYDVEVEKKIKSKL